MKPKVQHTSQRQGKFVELPNKSNGRRKKSDKISERFALLLNLHSSSALVGEQ